jgi:hypothetical protein
VNQTAKIHSSHVLGLSETKMTANTKRARRGMRVAIVVNTV